MNGLSIFSEKPFFVVRLVCLFCSWLTWPVLAAPTVTLLLSEPSGIYQEAAESLSRSLQQEPQNFSISWASPESYVANSDLTVAIGTRALNAALAKRGVKPVLSLLVPRQTYERLTGSQQDVSALYLDQPLDRQLRLLKLAVPDLKKVAVPYGAYSRGIQASLDRSSREAGVPVKTSLLEDGGNLYRALTSLAEDSQAFLLLPDPMVVQRNSLHNFFLHTYRLKKPVLAFSEPLVNSGALLGLYATPAQLGEEAASWIRQSWYRDEFRLGPARYPASFTIMINHTVARSLEIALPDEGRLSRQLEVSQ